MSGHSKWATIKRQKGLNDAKKGQAFTRLSKDIIFAASEGGHDPASNFKLRLAVDRAKAVNMPKEKIERAIRKGAGLDQGDKLEQIVYEAYGPGGCALLIEVQTDNRNRSVAEMKQIVEKRGGKMVPAGSISWSFRQVGVLLAEISLTEDVELRLLETPGLIDFYAEEGAEGPELSVYVQKEELTAANRYLREQEIDLKQSGLGYRPNERVELNDADLTELSALEDDIYAYDDVIDVWHNVN